VTGNHFNLVGSPVIVIGDQDDTDAAHMASNAFSYTGSNDDPAIRIHGGTRHTVVGNTFHGFAATGAIWLSGALSPDDVSLEANIEL